MLVLSRWTDREIPSLWGSKGDWQWKESHHTTKFFKNLLTYVVYIT